MNIYFGFQRTLSSSWMLESAFVATRGVKFPMERVFNAVDRLTGLRPNPNLGKGYYEDNTQNTVYASWLAARYYSLPVTRGLGMVGTKSPAKE